MFVRIDLSVVPPSVSLQDDDRFDEFHVELMRPRHVHVGIGQLLELAGERVRDPEWVRGFHEMIGYAREHGWVDDGRGVRAHVKEEVA
jgi:hypothetical protein